MLQLIKKKWIEFKDAIKDEIDDCGGIHIFLSAAIIVLIIWPFALLYYILIRPIFNFIHMLYDVKEYGLKNSYRKNFHSNIFKEEQSHQEYEKRKALKEPLLPPGRLKQFNDRENWPDAFIVDNIAVYGANGRTLLFVDENTVEFDIPEGVENIYHRCFAFCYKLERVTFPTSLKRVGKRAFYSCVSLKDVSLPESVSMIGEEMFMDCSSLEHVTLPNQTRQIPTRFFAKCRNLKSFHLPREVNVIGEEAFRRCYSLEVVEMNSCLERIKKKAFEDCYSLKEFIMPESVKACTEGMFNGCHSLQHIHFSSKIKDFGGSCCRDCWNIQQISMPNDEHMKSYAKEQWEKYSDKCDISKSENPIPNCMFWTYRDTLYFGIPRLSTVCLVFCFSKEVEFTIPSFVTNVKRDAFTSCRNLRTLRLSPYIKASDDPWEHTSITYDFIYEYWPQIENTIFDETLKYTEYVIGLSA